MMPTPIFIPLLNPNEPEALLASMHVAEGQLVSKGDPICTLETTKSTADVEAESNGYVVGLRFAPGQTVRAGELLCTLAESPDWQPPLPEAELQHADSERLPEGLRITQPAIELARQLSIPLERLPVGPLVTEALVRSHAERAAAPAPSVAHASDFDPTAILVYGGGGHGKSLIDLLRLLGCYRIAGVLDDGIPAGGSILGVPLLGGAEVLPELHARGVRLAVNAVGGIGSVGVRIKVFQRLAEAGFTCPAVVHPRALVEPSAALSPGVQVFPHAYVGSDARLGYGTIANTGAIISHDCVLGDYVNISPGAILAGGVRVGDEALIGMGATVNLLVEVGRGARVGNGATVKSDVPEGGVVRAGTIYPI